MFLLTVQERWAQVLLVIALQMVWLTNAFSSTSSMGSTVLIHETSDAPGHAWAYSLLLSTFPLTWDEARAACEVVPGAMLARVEGWEAEAALGHYLQELGHKEAVWLANRQTLPQVLLEEQESLQDVEGEVGNWQEEEESSRGARGGPQFSLGQDVGVTLRCAVFQAGVGIIHELCSIKTVSAAVCVQRMSSTRPLRSECPPSPRRLWLLMTHLRELQAGKEKETSLTKLQALQECHHRHQLGTIYCHSKSGWGDLICPSENSPKHHKALHRNHHSHHLDQAHWEHNKIHGRSGDKHKGHPRLARQVDVTQFFAHNRRQQRDLDEPQHETETLHFSVGESQQETEIIDFSEVDTHMQQMGDIASEMKVAALASVDSIDSIADIMKGLGFDSKKKKEKDPYETEINSNKDDKNEKTEQSTVESGPIKVSESSINDQTANRMGEAIEVKEVSVDILEDTSSSTSNRATEETKKETGSNIPNMIAGLDGILTKSADDDTSSTSNRATEEANKETGSNIPDMFAGLDDILTDFAVPTFNRDTEETKKETGSNIPNMATAQDGIVPKFADEDTSSISNTATEETKKETGSNISNMATGLDDMLTKFADDLYKSVESITEPMPEPEPTKSSENKARNSDSDDQESTITKESHTIMFPAEAMGKPEKDPNISIPTESTNKSHEMNPKSHSHPIGHIISIGHNTKQPNTNIGDDMIEDPIDLISIQNSTKNHGTKSDSSPIKDDSIRPDNISEHSDLSKPKKDPIISVPTESTNKSNEINTKGHSHPMGHIIASAHNTKQQNTNIENDMIRGPYDNIKPDDISEHSELNTRIINTDFDNNEQNLPDIQYTLDGQTKNSTLHKDYIDQSKPQSYDNHNHDLENGGINDDNFAGNTVDNDTNNSNTNITDETEVINSDKTAVTGSIKSTPNESQNNNDRTGRNRNIEDQSFKVPNTLLENEDKTDGVANSEIKSIKNSITNENSETEMIETRININKDGASSTDTNGENREISFPVEQTLTLKDIDKKKEDMHGIDLDKKPLLPIESTDSMRSQEDVIIPNSENKESMGNQESSKNIIAESVVATGSSSEITKRPLEEIEIPDDMEDHSSQPSSITLSESTGINDSKVIIETTATKDAVDEHHTIPDEAVEINSESDNHDSSSKDMNGSKDMDKNVDSNEDTLDQMNKDSIPAVDDIKVIEEISKPMKEVLSPMKEVLNQMNKDINPIIEESNIGNDATKPMDENDKPKEESMDLISEASNPMRDASNPLNEDTDLMEEDNNSKKHTTKPEDEITKTNDKSTDLMSEVSIPLNDAPTPIKEEPKVKEDIKGLKPVEESQNLASEDLEPTKDIINNNDKEATSEETSRTPKNLDASEPSTNDDSSVVSEAGTTPTKSIEENSEHNALLTYILTAIFG